jgi:hypothetical protein
LILILEFKLKRVVGLFFVVGLQGCVKDMPPMADTSNAAKITYTKISFASGERQSLWMFDNARLEGGAGSGRLIEHGNFAKQSASVYVPAGERKYFKASYLLARPAAYGAYISVSECSAGVSFIPEHNRSYTLTQQPSDAGCIIKLVDEENIVPASLSDLGVLK